MTFCLVEERSTTTIQAMHVSMVRISSVRTVLLTPSLTCTQPPFDRYALPELLDSSCDRYSDTSDDSQKKAILKEIVSTVLETGQFLKRDDCNRWTALTTEKALLKTAHAMQYRLRKKRTGGPAPQSMMKAKTQRQIPLFPQQLAPHPHLPPFDAAAASSQASWDLHYQWMTQSNAQFWQYAGPEAHRWHSANVTAKEPLRPNISADVAEDETKRGGP
jgi:hypothetical protein